MNKNGPDVTLHWQRVIDDDDPHWGHNCGLYAYLAPRKAEIYYIGKCDGTTVRGRWRYGAKPKVWNCIYRQSQHHRLIVAGIELHKGQRLGRQLLKDIEALLIYHVRPICNDQNTGSRGRYNRPGLKVKCRGAWPLPQKTFIDD